MTTARRRLPVSVMRVMLGAMLVAAAAGCETGGIYLPGETAPVLSDGLYYFEAWPDRATHDPDWWGWLDLRIGSDRRIRGTYRLPDQCRDRFNYIVDCVGYLDGRVEHDGRFRFALDEGWIRGDGRARTRHEAYGRWDARIVGYSERGDFTLTWDRR